ASFAAKSPSHTYSILDKQGAVALVDHVAATYPGYANIRQLFDAIPRTVIRADFLRFLLLAVEGGVYSDSDTLMVRPLADWVPDGLKDRTRLIVGIEADAGRHSMLIKGTSHRVQFCQWTLAGAPGHPALWAMVDRVLERTAAVKTFSDAEVLDLGGPAGWTEVVFEHLRKETGTVVTWENMTGMREPRLFGDTLVLPIDGFATGVPHSGSSQDWTDMTMVQHMFFGGWKDSGM
ncbi:family 32 glycosyltransferase, partial [Cryphonectria parasitica EP155]